MPKERFVELVGCESDEHGEPVYLWAGLDHRQRAWAVVNYFNEAQSTLGWEPERLKVLLAVLLDVLPWLKQWHNELDEYNMRFGEVVDGFYAQKCQELNLPPDEVEARRIGS